MNEGMEFVYNSLQTDEFTLENALSVYNILQDREANLDMEVGTTYHAQGGLIAKIKEKDLWRQFPGVEGWWEFGFFIKQKFGMSLQKALALKKIWERSVGLMSPTEIQLCGWFTTSEILRNCNTREEVERYIDMAKKGVGKTEILQLVRESNPHRRSRTITWHKRKVAFEEHEAQFFDESLEKAAVSVGRSLGENMRREEALMLIISQWRELREKVAA